MKDYPEAITAWLDGLRRVLGDWRWVLATSLLLLVACVTIAMFSLIDSRSDLRRQLDASDALTECRSALTATVTDSQTDYLLAIGDLVEGIANDASLTPLVVELGHAADELDAARDARVAFETNPADPSQCPEARP